MLICLKLADLLTKVEHHDDKLHPSNKKRMMICSIVSSQFLKDYCEKHNLVFQNTLTGFKYISNLALQLKKEEGYDVKRLFYD